jgi:phage tail sheath gpL-like
MSTAVAVRNPRVTLNRVSRDQTVGLGKHRVLLVGQISAAANAAAGFYADLPRTEAEIDEIAGADSHFALIARKFRRVNEYTEVDAILLEDAGGSTAGTSSVLLAGTATSARTVFFDIVSSQNHSYEVDIAIGDDEAAVTAKLLAKIALDTRKPFTAAKSTVTNTDDTTTFTAVSKGTISNNWLIRVRDKFNRPPIVPGMTITLTGWAGGATDPTLTSIFDDVANIRYQGVVWPEAYTNTTLLTWIDARFNVDNDIKDGVAFQWVEDSFANVKTLASNANSPSYVIMTNESVNEAHWKGPYLPEAPDVLTATFVAARARRFEEDISISDLVVTNELNDQFGGIHTCTLPYFNTPFLEVRQPDLNAGYSDAEQLELSKSGVSVVGRNVKNNGVISSVVVTTYLNDDAGNEDDTWQWLNWQDTHSIVREYIVNNIRDDLDQHRMTTGTAPANFAIMNEPILRALIRGYCENLMGEAIVVEGRPSSKYIDENLVVVLDPANRSAAVGLDFWMVSQFQNLKGTIKFSFAV